MSLFCFFKLYVYNKFGDVVVFGIDTISLSPTGE
jgi:hypothetical protein